MEGFPYGPPGSPEYAAYQAEWAKWKRKRNPAWAKENSRKNRLHQLKNPVWAARILCKGSARRRGYEYNLSDEVFEYLVKQDCAYCGAAPNPLNGIDRIDNAIGYIDDNVATACRICNMAKAEMDFDEFREWVKRLAKQMER